MSTDKNSEIVGSTPTGQTNGERSTESGNSVMPPSGQLAEPAAAAPSNTPLNEGAEEESEEAWLASLNELLTNWLAAHRDQPVPEPLFVPSPGPMWHQPPDGPVTWLSTRPLMGGPDAFPELSEPVGESPNEPWTGPMSELMIEPLHETPDTSVTDATSDENPREGQVEEPREQAQFVPPSHGYDGLYRSPEMDHFQTSYHQNVQRLYDQYNDDRFEQNYQRRQQQFDRLFWQYHQQLGQQFPQNYEEYWEQLNMQLNEPPNTQLNETPNTQLNEPPNTQLSEPPNMQLNEPPNTQLNEPPNTQPNEPPNTQLDEQPNTQRGSRKRAREDSDDEWSPDPSSVTDNESLGSETEDERSRRRRRKRATRARGRP